VLVEGQSKKHNGFSGRCRQNIVVNLEFRDNITKGKIANVVITKALKHSLVGKVQGH